MLKCILLLLSEYYYGIVSERIEEIRKIVNPNHVEVFLRRASAIEEMEAAGDKSSEDISFACNNGIIYIEETLIITDDPKAAEILLDRGRYVVILYHEQNRSQNFPAAKYGMEDLFQLEYKSYQEVYQRLAGQPWEILQTDRLLVRESVLEDVDEFYRIYREPSITLYMEDLYKDRDEELAYMKAYIDRIYGFYGYGLWTVVLKDTGQVIGRAGLSVREGYELPELGFLIEVSYQKQGYGFEVCNGILQYAKEVLEFEKIQALAEEKNIISVHLLEKLGFEFERNVIEAHRDYKLFIKKI